ncbi:MAG: hypothetical protein LBS03_00760 [Bacteroidales bacterium]|nr:hypothetical protein [Bacteroidales bacterium]
MQQQITHCSPVLRHGTPEKNYRHHRLHCLEQLQLLIAHSKNAREFDNRQVSRY